MAAPNDLILFHYPRSPAARQVVWYLTLLGVEYAECIQPQGLPRPDLEAIGVQYRRIPLMAVGRDIYCDSRLILRKLTQMFPTDHLLPQTAEHRAILRLMEKWTQSSLFGLAASLLPLSYPAFRSEEFLRDREAMTGFSFDLNKWPRKYPESRVNMREAFELLENTILSDGRPFLLNTSDPTLADIEAIFPLEWVVADPDMQSALPANYISDTHFPKVYAWIGRFKEAIEKAKSKKPLTVTLNGQEALSSIRSARLIEPVEQIDIDDPLALEKGTEVQIFPVDSGSTHKDRGKLIVLTPEEVAVRTQTKVNSDAVTIHMPRTGFRVIPITHKL